MHEQEKERLDSPGVRIAIIGETWQFGEFRFHNRTVSSIPAERNCSSVGDISRDITCFLWPLK